MMQYFEEIDRISKTYLMKAIIHNEGNPPDYRKHVSISYTNENIIGDNFRFPKNQQLFTARQHYYPDKTKACE